MNIEIMPHHELFVRSTYKWAIIINSPSENRIILSDEFLSNKFADYLYLEFHDIDFHKAPFISPQLHHVQKMLDFVANKDELVVACQAGISRSSAIAYGILCSVIKPSEAIKILNPKLHYPNLLIVELFSQVLNNDIVWDTFDQWLITNSLI